jgi:RNA polymerase-binding transcription factor DksA
MAAACIRLLILKGAASAAFFIGKFRDIIFYISISIPLIIKFIDMKEQKLDKKFLDEQKQELEKEKARLEEALGKIGQEKSGNSNDYKATYQEYGDDEESNAAEYAQTETNTSALEQLETELQAVVLALKGIKEGTYGIDVNTGKPINKKRLKVYPAAQTDIDHE